MKFPRNAKIFRGQLDAAPFAGVFFLLLMFLLLASLIYTPGVRIELPAAAADLAGVAGPTVAVAMDKNGQIYYENQMVPTNELKRRFSEVVAKSSQPPVLVVEADKGVSIEDWTRLLVMARSAGITNALQVVLPRVLDRPAGNLIP